MFEVCGCSRHSAAVVVQQSPTSSTASSSAAFMPSKDADQQIQSSSCGALIGPDTSFQGAHADRHTRWRPTQEWRHGYSLLTCHRSICMPLSIKLMSHNFDSSTQAFCTRTQLTPTLQKFQFDLPLKSRQISSNRATLDTLQPPH